MDKLKAVLTRREDPEANNITEDDRGFISETLDASTLSYRSFKNYVDKILGLFSPNISQNPKVSIFTLISSDIPFCSTFYQHI